MIVERKTLSILQACKLVGVSRRTIYNWLSTGKVEYVRTAGGSVRIFADTLFREPGTPTRTIPTHANQAQSSAPQA
jgi:excisionase family DNA binding protein